MNYIFSEKVKKELITIYDLLRWTVSVFTKSNIFYGHGTNNALDEAIQLILPTLSLPLHIPDDMYHSKLLISERNNIINNIIKRINYRIPVAYITNKSWFCEREIYVDNRVFIPRSPIAELINQQFSSLINYHPQSILDLCTGSGCIAISCAYMFPETEISAIDLSNDALTIAKKNIKKHNLNKQIKLIQSDLFSKLKNYQYDIIITNPPYVSKKEIKNLPEEYQHEPQISLISSKNGLNIVHHILKDSVNYLTNRGILICEVGDNMFNLIKQFPDIPFKWLDFQNGGYGVFMLTKQELINSSNILNKI